MVNRPKPCLKMLLAALLAGSICSSSGLVQAAPQQDKTNASQPAASASAAVAPAPKTPQVYVPRSERAARYYRWRWGIDNIAVQETSSGSLIRFSYRVVYAEKAKILNDKRFTPYLIDEKNGLALQVPVVDQVGQLRQVAAPQNGREYWMTFSNKARSVRAGSHVTVIIGPFRAEGLVVGGPENSR